MPSTQVEPVKELENDQIGVDGIIAETTEAPPPGMNRQEIQSVVSQEVAQALVSALPALLPELLKSLVPNVSSLPSQPVIVGGQSEAAPAKKGWLKHYRMDGVMSGKYQLIDVSKLDENGEIPVNIYMDSANHARSESPAVVKGQWVHFVNGHFYAQTQKEVDFIEWRMRTDPQFKAYEDRGAGVILCPVCGNNTPGFVDEETLKGHMKATHGVG